jgi:His/Glu/Gln/Arg/opine family amino acid ABC transporter permease subunit
MTTAAFLSLLQGAGVTLAVSVAGILLGVPIGLGIALIRWAKVPFLGRIAAVYVSLIRSTPLVTLCLLIFFATPSIGLDIGPLTAAVLALTLNTAAFNSEVWRSGLVSFSTDQIEAARAFGMRPPLAFRRVIFPQLWRSALPGLVNEMTLLIKGSPAIAVVGVVEITRAAVRIGAQTYDPLPPFMVATVLYAVLVFGFVYVQRYTERAYGRPGAAA